MHSPDGEKRGGADAATSLAPLEMQVVSQHMSNFPLIAAAFGFLIALFTLYRLLVERQDKTIALLKEEMAYRLNNKDRLQEINAFYETEKKILEAKLAMAGADRESLAQELSQANDQLQKVAQLEYSTTRDQKKTEAILERSKADMLNRLRELMDQNAVLSSYFEDQRKSYVELCEKIKERYGLAVIIELTSRSEYEEAKLRRQHISKAKYKRTFVTIKDELVGQDENVG